MRNYIRWWWFYHDRDRSRQFLIGASIVVSLLILAIVLGALISLWPVGMGTICVTFVLVVLCTVIGELIEDVL